MVCACMVDIVVYTAKSALETLSTGCWSTAHSLMNPLCYTGSGEMTSEMTNGAQCHSLPMSYWKS